MTSNVHNHGIFHLAHRPGGDPFCKARRAHMSTTPAEAERHNYAVCKRCAAKLEKMRAAAARRAAFEDAVNRADAEARDAPGEPGYRPPYDCDKEI